MRVKTEERLKIESLKIGKIIYFPDNIAIRISGYVARLNDNARRKRKTKENLNPYSFRDKTCNKEGYVCVVRNY